MNVTPPAPFGVSVMSTSASVPIADIEASLFICKPFCAVPVIMVELATSTFNTGLAVSVASPTWKSLAILNDVPYNAFSTPAIDIPNSSGFLWKRPVVAEVTKFKLGAAAVPSAIPMVAFVSATLPVVCVKSPSRVKLPVCDVSPVTVCVPVIVNVSVAASSPNVRLPLTVKSPSAVISPVVTTSPSSASIENTVEVLPIVRLPSSRVGCLVPAILNASEFKAPSCVNSNLSSVTVAPTVKLNGLPVVEGPDSLAATLGINVCPTLYPNPPSFILTSLIKPT